MVQPGVVWWKAMLDSFPGIEEIRGKDKAIFFGGSIP